MLPIFLTCAEFTRKKKKNGHDIHSSESVLRLEVVSESTINTPRPDIGLFPAPKPKLAKCVR